MITNATPAAPPRTFLRLPASEWKRKAVHMGSFAGAFLLPYLTPKQAALMAIGALLFNMFVLPKLMPSIIRREGNSGYLEILMYPAAVLITILSLDSSAPWSVFLVWAVLAVGDGLIGIIYSLLKSGRNLHWNERKSLKGYITSILVIGALLAWYIFLTVDNTVRHGPMGYNPSYTPFNILAVSLAVAVLLVSSESWWFGIVDNLVLPLTATIVFMLAPAVVSLLTNHGTASNQPDLFSVIPWMAIGVSLLFSIMVYVARKATARGAFLGFVFSTYLMMVNPWLFAYLLGFFSIGVLATKYKSARKERAGIAEARHGQRDAAEVFGALGVMAWMGSIYFALNFIPVRVGHLPPYLLIILSPLIAKTMDTVSSEMGKAIGGTTISLRTFKVVPPGTDGGVSLAGTIWGLAGAALLAMLILPLHWGGWKEVGLLLAFAVAANLFESYWAFWAGPRGVDDGPHTNFMMTLFAATLAWFWWM